MNFDHFLYLEDESVLKAECIRHEELKVFEDIVIKNNGNLSQPKVAWFKDEIDIVNSVDNIHIVIAYLHERITPIGYLNGERHTKIAAETNDVSLIEEIYLLSEKYDGYANYSIARNPNTTFEILDDLISKRDSNLNVFLASNESIDEEMMEILSNDRSEVVQANLANNKNVSDEILSKILRNRSQYVSQAAGKFSNFYNTHMMNNKRRIRYATKPCIDL